MYNLGHFQQYSGIVLAAKVKKDLSFVIINTLKTEFGDEEMKAYQLENISYVGGCFQRILKL